MKILISPESAWFTDSFSTFGNQKIAHRKKVRRFLIPEFNLTINLMLHSNVCQPITKWYSLMWDPYIGPVTYLKEIMHVTVEAQN